MPYETTDAHGHRLIIARAAAPAAGPHVELQADNTAIGGETVSVWLTEAAGREFAVALSVADRYHHTDHMGDRLDMARADDWTTFTLTREPRDEYDETETVRVVILTARLPEIRAAILDSLPATTPEPAEGDTPSTPAPRDRAVLEVTRDGWTGGTQLNISQLDADGCGSGYRIAGPKFNGSSKPVLTVELDERDAAEIRAVLDAVFPPPPAAAQQQPAPAARRVLTDDEYDATYIAARRAIGTNAANRAGNDTVYGVIDAALAAVGILAPPPMPDDETCSARFADEFGDWHQCAEEPGHDPADGHDSGEWGWPEGAPDSIPPGGTAPASAELRDADAARPPTNSWEIEVKERGHWYGTGIRSSSRPDLARAMGEARNRNNSAEYRIVRATTTYTVETQQ